MEEKKAVRVAYGEALVKLGESNEKVVVLDADLAAATMTGVFKKAFPNRFYDCGIAEANMVDMAAGMSTMGLIPFCSTFAAIKSPSVLLDLFRIWMYCIDTVAKLANAVRGRK